MTIGDRLKRLAEIAREAGYQDPRCPSIAWVDEKSGRGVNAGKGYFVATSGFSAFGRLQHEISGIGETPEAALDKLALAIVGELEKERLRLAASVQVTSEAYERTAKALLDIASIG